MSQFVWESKSAPDDKILAVLSDLESFLKKAIPDPEFTCPHIRQFQDVLSVLSKRSVGQSHSVLDFKASVSLNPDLATEFKEQHEFSVSQLQSLSPSEPEERKVFTQEGAFKSSISDRDSKLQLLKKKPSLLHSGYKSKFFVGKKVPEVLPIISLLCSCVRNLEHSISKIVAVKLLHYLG
jgi:hypothetical protein